MDIAEIAALNTHKAVHLEMDPNNNELPKSGILILSICWQTITTIAAAPHLEVSLFPFRLR